MIAEACWQGWSKEDGNKLGRCCCNCRWQRPISGHPWNKNPSFRGSVSTPIAWGCTVPDMPLITLSEREHSICEMWEKRSEISRDF